MLALQRPGEKQRVQCWVCASELFRQEGKIRRHDWDVKINRHLFCMSQESRGLLWRSQHQTLAGGVDRVTSVPVCFFIFSLCFFICASWSTSNLIFNIYCKMLLEWISCCLWHVRHHTDTFSKFYSFHLKIKSLSTNKMNACDVRTEDLSPEENITCPFCTFPLMIMSFRMFSPFRIV